MKFSNKIKWIASILLVFLIVLSTNLIDRANFNRINGAVTTIYEDRMVATAILMDMVIHIKDKEVALLSSDTVYSNKENKAINKAIASNMEAFKKTKLTDGEQIVFDNLEGKINELIQLERNHGIAKEVILQKTAVIVEKLQELSEIQLKEGKQQMLISNNAMKIINWFTKGEIIFLILIAILLQVIIFYKPVKAYEDSH
ncbi:Four helix bundle sensory module for signal transduction [Pustulibacterium marinum]|uniref:Four helix bundle sensory module for signal transduction n=1 Tax=Pustulibacterium marinum TaxID=1224947 RepID=A0A1I7IQ91_9FLAO|nr:MCP four helix bundle domain-containing protein [Pustulibacterium marinum]SFU75125.1 Four helix bundle sensory module for signal transduction [Pustulibacterium marinum]